MTIKTVTAYATSGYSIYRNAWIDPITNQITKILAIFENEAGEMTYMQDSEYHAILAPEDCLADDWQIITDYL